MSTTTVTAWVDRLQSDIARTEWAWRSLDERDWRSPASAGRGRNTARRELEDEAAQLRAELAVASFLAVFRRPDGASEDLSIINRLGFAMLIQAEAERSALPDVEIRWGPATTIRAPGDGAWRVDVEAVYLWHGETLSRQQYSFHVVGDRVEGWRTSLRTGQVGP